MFSGFERSLQRRWYGEHPPGAVLRALAALYGAAMRLRRFAYRIGFCPQQHLDVPVVVVGNRTLGGAGKTPTVIALVEALCARGWRPGVASRGYGRREKAPRGVSATSLPTDVGDEPLLIHLLTGVPVEVDRRRTAAARRLAAAGCDVVIADDGLQHLRLGRRIEIEVQDGRGLGNGRVLPAGPLREPLPRRAADLRVVHGRPPRDGEVPMQLVLGVARRLDNTETRALASFVAGQVHAVAGIGHPPRFFAALRAFGITVIEHPFPDHHAFIADDFAAMIDAPVLMTSKDAVKCRGFALADAWEIPVSARLSEAVLDALDHQLRTVTTDVTP